MVSPLPKITDTPPAYVRSELEAVRAALDSAVPLKRPKENLLIATWNIRAFGSLTRRWTARSNDSPKRDFRGLRVIAEVVSRFDVVAVQEVVGDLRALRAMMELLGEQWGFLMTDVTLGDAGNNERMAFVFDRSRVRPSGLACELVLPPKWMKDEGEDVLRRQFARTPYAVSFKAGDKAFILVTLHVDFGEDADERTPELKAIARWLASWARRENRWHNNLIALGDFNIDRRGDKRWRAFTSTGLTVPEDLNKVKRSIFSKADDPTTDKFYDQIAWFKSTSGIPRLSMTHLRSGHFDFLPHVYGNTSLTRRSVSFRISDHYPLWSEFELD